MTKTVPQQPTSSILCAEKQRFLDELGGVMKRIMSLLSQEMEAVIGGDLSRHEALQAELKKAHELKSSLMGKLKLHVASHGC